KKIIRFEFSLHFRWPFSYILSWPFTVAANNNHAVTLDGFNKAGNQVHVSDPISGSYWLSRTTFEAIYNARKFAVVVR
ncbi:hypothetical protein P7D68_06030, partial [Enterococcus avium]|nr:hypothetical protein [Enterococcus avium]